VRRAKDNLHVPKRYYRPEQTTCPRCGQVLKRCYAVGRKYIVFLSGRYFVVSLGYRCPNQKCAWRHRVYASQVARRLTVRGSSFALEVIAQIGYWRFWKRWTVSQIHEVLTQERHLPISEREVLYLMGVFLVLLRCTYHLRLKEQAVYFRRHGLFLAIDALKPEKGNRALYVVRELKFGLVLNVVSVLSADHNTWEKRVLKPVKALGYRVRGLVSDDEKALQLAVTHVFPGVSHQTCQVQCLRDAATPIADADRAFKKALKQAIRGPFYAAQRELNRLTPADPCHAVLSTYAELIQSTLTEGSKPPFELGGLRVFEDLARLEASLQRSRKKGAIRCWISWWPWFNIASRLQPSIDNSNANGAGWWNWIDVSTHRKSRASRAQPVEGSSNTFSNFWPSWKTMPNAVPQTHRWSRISVLPSGSVGHGSSPVTLGPSATAPTMIWKPSLAVCAPVNVRFMAASPCMSSSSAMGSGLSSLTLPSPSSKCYIAFNSLTKQDLIRSMPAS